MSIGLAFWILMLLWLVTGIYWNRSELAAGNFWPIGGNLMLFILLLLLGWHAFGPPIR